MLTSSLTPSISSMTRRALTGAGDNAAWGSATTVDAKVEPLTTPIATAAALLTRKPRRFHHKLGVALKELNETAVWLRIIRGSFHMETNLLTKLVAENTELCRILVASIQTARRNKRKDNGH